MKHSTDIYKLATTFVKRSLYRRVCQETILMYLKTEGYTVVYYTLDKPNELIELYNKTEESKVYNAFTVCRKTDKFVFLRSDITEDRKFYALLHETGHIALGHMEHDHIPKHKRLEEMETEAFAYAVLQNGFMCV